jgi:hypothetical protein
MVPPRNVALKIGDELFKGSKFVGTLLTANVSMVAFTHLIIVSQDAFTSYHIGQPVFEAMSRPDHSHRHSP